MPRRRLTRRNWAELTGEPTQIRWAAALRAERVREIRDAGIREWLGTTWTKAKSWVDTRDLPTPVFLQRIAPHYAEYRKKSEERARVLASERQAKQAAADQIRKAGRRCRDHRRRAYRVDRRLRSAAANAD